MKSVGLLYDSVSSNTGDIAIGIAISQALDKRGIKSIILDPYTYNNNPNKTVIVGGGQLLRDPGDEFYDKFRVKGKNILNSVGVSGTKDFSYLKDYLYLSTRSKFESGVIEKYVGSPVDVVPCITTIMESDKYIIPNLHRKPGEKIVGVHIVPDVLIMCPDIINIINKIPHKKVFIPFTHYNQDASFMRNLPFDKTNSIMLDKLEPLELHSVISQMDYVIVSSLHASIFAYTQNVPFISMYQKKAYDYFRDRNLERYIYETQSQLNELINYVDNHEIDMSEMIEKDKKLANQAIDTYAEIIEKQVEPSNESVLSSADSTIDRLNLQIKQLEGVVEKRDILIHNSIYENIRSKEKGFKSLRDEINNLKDEIDLLKSSSIKKIIQKCRRKLFDKGSKNENN